MCILAVKNMRKASTPASAIKCLLFDYTVRNFRWLISGLLPDVSDD